MALQSASAGHFHGLGPSVHAGLQSRRHDGFASRLAMKSSVVGSGAPPLDEEQATPAKAKTDKARVPSKMRRMIRYVPPSRPASAGGACVSSGGQAMAHRLLVARSQSSRRVPR